MYALCGSGAVNTEVFLWRFLCAIFCVALNSFINFLERQTSKLI